MKSGQEPSLKTEIKDDSFADFTSSERVQEYRKTGNPDSLNMETARYLRIDPLTMANVVGASEQDIQDAENWEKQKLAEERAHLQELLDYATAPLDSGLVTHGLALRQSTLFQLREYVLQNEENVYRLFDAIRYSESEGINDVNAVHDIYGETHRLFVELSHRSVTEEEADMGYACANALNKFIDVSRAVLEHINSKKIRGSNYLTIKYLEDFAHKVEITGDAHIDQDGYLPFEIEDGKYAIFDGPGTYLYVLDRSNSEKYRPHLEQIVGKIRTREVGQYFARHQVSQVPDELFELLHEMVSDAAEVLAAPGQFGADQPDLTRDYINFLRSDIRRVVEVEFGFNLKALAIKEQFYFLNFLKRTSVEEAKTVQHFTSNPKFGVDGLRTFLSLERGDVTGDQIVAFATEYENAAAEIFAHYATLLDRAAVAEELVRRELPDDPDIETIVKEVEQAILDRAHKAIIRAVVKGDVGDVLQLIKESSIDAIGVGDTFVALKKRGFVKSFAEMQSLEQKVYSGEELKARPDVLEKITTLYKERWSENDADLRLRWLAEHLEKSGAELTTEWLGDKVIGTVLTEVSDGDVYIGSLNATTDRSIQQLQIGTGLVEQVIERYAQSGKTLSATSLLDTAASYMNIYGFVAVEQLDNPNGTEARVHLMRNDAWEISSKQLSRDQILQLAEKKDSDTSEKVIVEKTNDKNELPGKLPLGYGITRRIKSGGNYYYVLERLDVGRL